MKSGKNSVKHKGITLQVLSSFALTNGRLLLAKASNDLVRTITMCMQRTQQNWHAVLLSQTPRHFCCATDARR
jgi:hypothetical protein